MFLLIVLEKRNAYNKLLVMLGNTARNVLYII